MDSISIPISYSLFKNSIISLPDFIFCLSSTIFPFIYVSLLFHFLTIAFWGAYYRTTQTQGETYSQFFAFFKVGFLGEGERVIWTYFLTPQSYTLNLFLYSLSLYIDRIILSSFVVGF